jgi:thymidylate synthase
MFKNVTYAFREGLRTILQEGEIISVRAHETKEVRSHLIKIASPLERVYIIPHRNNNIFAQIAETLWMIAGRNDMAFLSRYLPRAVDFSDDSKVWRGAYGTRLRNWQGIDQIKEVANLLNKDSYSRRAVMVIFDPAQDYIESKDIPCNNLLHFLIRDNRLHLNVSIRSNDIWWGFSGINTFEWSVLHEMMAYWTGAQVGEYSHFASSFHLYERHYQQAEKIIANVPDKTLYDFGFTNPRFSTPLEEFDEVMGQWFAIEDRMRQGETNLSQEINKFSDRFLNNCLEMLYIYNRHLHGADKEEIAQLIENLPTNDFKIGAIEYFSRKFKNRELVKLQDKEQEYFQYFWATVATDKLSVGLPVNSASPTDNPSVASPVNSALSPTDNPSFASIFAQLSTLHYKKSLVYKDSWKKHGEVLGVFSNITRKYDRIEVIMTEGLKSTADESLLDTVADLAVYSTKYLTYLAEHYPGIFKDFILQYSPIEPRENYWYNKGFDSVAKILIRRYESSAGWQQLSSYGDCFAAITKYYKGLEDVLINGDWRRSDPRKCSLAADLALSAMHYLVLTSTKETGDFQKLVSFIETL